MTYGVLLLVAIYFWCVVQMSTQTQTQPAAKPNATEAGTQSPAKSKDPKQGQNESKRSGQGEEGVFVGEDGRKVVSKPSTHLWQPKKRHDKSESDDDGAQGDESTRKKSPAKKVDGCSPRIAATEVKPHVPLPPIVAVKKLTAEEQAAQVEKVYEQARQQREKERQKLKEKSEASSAPGPASGNNTPRTEEEVQEMALRLSTQECKNRAARHDELLRKYLERPRADSPPKPRPSTADASPEVVTTRLYGESIKHQREVTETLTRLYTPQKQAKRLTAEEWKKVTDNLSSPRK